MVKISRAGCLLLLTMVTVLCIIAFREQAGAEALYGQQLQALGHGSEEKHELRTKILRLVQGELAVPETEDAGYGTSRMLVLSLPEMPAWVAKQVLVAYRGNVFLVGIDKDAENIEILDHTSEVVYVNLAKFEAFCQEDRITIWSQRPSTAAELITELAWDGTRLKVISARYGDPTAEYYGMMTALLETGRLPEAMAAERAVFYPASYDGYYKVPQLAILKAHAYALEAYRAGDAASAASVLKWGLDQYLSVQGDGPLSLHSLSRLKWLDEPRNPRGRLYCVGFDEFGRILNDYAFFLAETGQWAEAEVYLKKVAEMMPHRAVVYINLGDVCWELGKYQEAAEYYRRYLALLGTVQNAPLRVKERAVSH